MNKLILSKQHVFTLQSRGSCSKCDWQGVMCIQQLHLQQYTKSEFLFYVSFCHMVAMLDFQQQVYLTKI